MRRKYYLLHVHLTDGSIGDSILKVEDYIQRAKAYGVEDILAMTDIDVDLSPEKRDEVFNYLVEKYGKNCCALVSTFHIRKARGAFKDAARLFNIPAKTANEISKLIPQIYYDDGTKINDLSISKALETSEKLRHFQQKYPEVFEFAKKLEGLPSSTGIHAAGILISPYTLTNMIPLVRTNKGDILATSLNLQDAENCFVKYDLLALATTSLIANTEKDANFKFNYRDEKLFNDNEVWNIIGSKNTTGIFQISSQIYKNRMNRLKSRSIKQLADCLALVRAPSISTKTDQKYIEILEGKKQIELIHLIFDEITSDTNGILIYQEQVMNLVVKFGFDLTTGYKIIKLAAKKNTSALKKFREDFIKKATEKNCSEKTANKIFDLIEKSSEYSFNQSHAVSYALMVYASAYLKVHFPLEYMKNLLTNTWERGEKENYSEVLKECRRLNIEFLPPNINKSQWNFTIENKKIRIGFCAIKGFGEKFLNKIIELRPITNFTDLLTRSTKRFLSKQVTSALLFSGTFRTNENEIRNLYKKYLRENYHCEVDKTVKIGTGITIDFDSDYKSWQKEILSEVFI